MSETEIKTLVTEPTERAALDQGDKAEEKKVTILDEDACKEFIENREIKPEHLHIIESLVLLPKSIFLENHNYYSSIKFLPKEQVRAQLLKDATIQEENARNQNNDSDRALYADRQKYYELMAEFGQFYDGTVLWNLNSIFRNRKKEI